MTTTKLINIGHSLADCTPHVHPDCCLPHCDVTNCTNTAVTSISDQDFMDFIELCPLHANQT